MSSKGGLMYHLNCLIYVLILGNYKTLKSWIYPQIADIPMLEVKCETVINGRILIMLNRLILLFYLLIMQAPV